MKLDIWEETTIYGPEGKRTKKTMKKPYSYVAILAMLSVLPTVYLVGGRVWQDGLATLSWFMLVTAMVMLLLRWRSDGPEWEEP